MTLKINEHKQEFIFLPLGGSGEIGMNLNLYHYKGKWLMVDCGAGFAEDYLPGVSMIVPDISFIAKHKDNLLGLVITHIHEDHVGGIQYLWEEFDCPIYATPLASAFIKARLAGMDANLGLSKRVKIHEVAEKSKMDIGPFQIEMVPLCHSTPEMQALVVTTELGSVFHTGDWKYDPDPLIGSPNDDELLKAYGKKGILALVGDSTNVFNVNSSGSEGALRKSLINLMSHCHRLLVVTTFASNVARLETLLLAAQQLGRRVVLAGRSVKRIATIAKECGYLKNVDEFIDEEDIGKYPRNELIIICTGCQGEPLAALTKMANNTHPRLKLAAGDTVIFSSKIIPGNDKKIFRVFNKLVQMGVETMTERDHFVHVSGHPSKTDLEKLFKLLKPKTAIPVHGEHVHMHEHAKLARSLGVPNVIEVENGDVVKLAPNEPCKLGSVEAGIYAIDGHTLLQSTSPILKMRRRLRDDGIIIITLIFSQNYSLRTDPIISAPGCLDSDEDRPLLMFLSEEIRDEVDRFVPGGNTKSNIEGYQKIIKSRVKSILKSEIGKMPEIEIIVRLV